MSTLIKSLKWRYATKKFDPSRKVREEDLNTILEAARLSASSYGLQPYKILVIEDAETREQLKEASWGQSQITDASHLVVLANIVAPQEGLVDQYMENVSLQRDIPVEELQGYATFIKTKLNALSTEDAANWTARQAYIVLGNLLAAAAELKVDTCPMEGFDNEAYNRILGLEAEGLNAAVVAAVGYRSPEDQTQYQKKVRQPKELLYTHI
mgnify:CR=1 FL=1